MLKRMTDRIWRDVNIEATLLFHVLFTASKDSSKDFLPDLVFLDIS